MTKRAFLAAVSILSVLTLLIIQLANIAYNPVPQQAQASVPISQTISTVQTGWEEQGIWHLEESVWRYADADKQTFETGSTNAGSLTTPKIVFGTPANTTTELSFESKLATEQSPYYDIASLEISADGGRQWSFLEANLPDSPEFSKKTYNISRFLQSESSEQFVQFKFSFKSVDVKDNAYFGWAIKNLQLNFSQSEPATLSVDLNQVSVPPHNQANPAKLKVLVKHSLPIKAIRVMEEDRQIGEATIDIQDEIICFTDKKCQPGTTSADFFWDKSVLIQPQQTSYTIQAEAIDIAGNRARSESVVVVFDKALETRLVSPNPGKYSLYDNIEIKAVAGKGQTISKVEFFNGKQKIGENTLKTVDCTIDVNDCVTYPSLFVFNWNKDSSPKLVAGKHILTAKLTNLEGQEIITPEIAVEVRDQNWQCPTTYQPVCGSDSKTYSNSCILFNTAPDGTTVDHADACEAVAQSQIKLNQTELGECTQDNSGTIKFYQDNFYGCKSTGWVKLG